MHPLIRSCLSLGVAALFLLSCSAPAPLVPVAGQQPSLTLPVSVPLTLRQPQGTDWSTDRVTSPVIQRDREAYLRASAPQAQAAQLKAAGRRVQAWPSAVTGWTAGGVNGVPLSTLNAAWGTDQIPNAPATAFYGATVPSSLHARVFFLTRGGRFIRINRNSPTTAPASVALGKTFSRTYVTLSPSCTRAYLLADDGTFFVVDTVNMVVLSTLNAAGASVSISVSGGRGLAACIDPYTSAHNDARDAVFIPGNDGRLTPVTVEPLTTPANSVRVAVGSPVTISSYATAGDRFVAPGIVLANVAYIGDQNGQFYAYNLADPASSDGPWDLGSPVNATPTIEIQDGTYALTDIDGNAVAGTLGAPCYAFVNAGRTCTWINLYDQSQNESLDLYVDDNDANRRFGYLLDYVSATVRLNRNLKTPGEIMSIATDGTTLPGSATFKQNTTAAPALTGLNTTGTAAGGPVFGFVRFQDNATPTANTFITRATLVMQANQSTTAPPPRVWTTANGSATPSFSSGATAPWTFAAMTNANRPALVSDVGTYRGKVNGGLVNFGAGKNYKWDVLKAFPSAGPGAVSLNPPAPPYHFSFGLRQNASPRTNYFWGTPPGAGEYRGVPFNGGNKTQLQMVYTTYAKYPVNTNLQTPPIVDPVRKMVYVVNCNQVFGLNYANETSFTDSDVDDNGAYLAKYTMFNELTYGIPSAGSGGMYNNKTSFVFNMAAPLMNFGGSALYALNAYPTGYTGGVPNSWNVVLSKVNLPLSATGGTNRLAGATTAIGGVASQTLSWLPNGQYFPNVGSATLLLDPYGFDTTTGNGVYFGLNNSRLYQYDP